jgi:hypothetical protein
MAKFEPLGLIGSSFRARSRARALTRTVLGLGAGLAIGAGCGSSGVAQGSSPATGAKRHCSGSTWSIALRHGSAAGPIAGGYLAFTNRADVPCRLSGWPAVQAVKPDGTSSHAINVRTTQFGPNVKGVPHVTVAPGGRADAVFYTDTLPPPGQSTCGPHYRFLRVRAPGSTRWARVSAWINSLRQDLPACSKVHVSMVVPPTALYHG